VLIAFWDPGASASRAVIAAAVDCGKLAFIPGILSIPYPIDPPWGWPPIRWITVQVSPPGTLISVPTWVFEVVATVAVRVNESVQTAIVIQTPREDLITGSRPTAVNFCHRCPSATIFSFSLSLSLSLSLSFFLIFSYSNLKKKRRWTPEKKEWFRSVWYAGKSLHESRGTYTFGSNSQLISLPAMNPPEAPAKRPPSRSKLVRINTATLADLENVRAFWFPPTRWCPTCRGFHPKHEITEELPDELDEKERPVVIWSCRACGVDFPRGWPRRKWEPAPPSWNELPFNTKIGGVILVELVVIE